MRVPPEGQSLPAVDRGCSRSLRGVRPDHLSGGSSRKRPVAGAKAGSDKGTLAVCSGRSTTVVALAELRRARWGQPAQQFTTAPSGQPAESGLRLLPGEEKGNVDTRKQVPFSTTRSLKAELWVPRHAFCRALPYPARSPSLARISENAASLSGVLVARYAPARPDASARPSSPKRGNGTWLGVAQIVPRKMRLL